MLLSSSSSFRHFFSPKALVILLSFFAVSCSGSLRESPVIYLSNVSVEKISNIEVRWARKANLVLPSLNPGESNGQSFYIRGDSDFFGEITVSWLNARGERVSKIFEIRQENLPSLSNRRSHNYVQLYFGQEDFEVVSSDSPDLRNKVRKMESLMRRYSQVYQDSRLQGRSPYLLLSQN